MRDLMMAEVICLVQQGDDAMSIQIGQVIGPLFGGIGSMTVRPVIGIGDDRPYEANVEVGLKVNF